MAFPRAFVNRLKPHVPSLAVNTMERHDGVIRHNNAAFATVGPQGGDAWQVVLDDSWQQMSGHSDGRASSHAHRGADHGGGHGTGPLPFDHIADQVGAGEDWDTGSSEVWETGSSSDGDSGFEDTGGSSSGAGFENFDSGLESGMESGSEFSAALSIPGSPSREQDMGGSHLPWEAEAFTTERPAPRSLAGRLGTVDRPRMMAGEMAPHQHHHHHHHHHHQMHELGGMVQHRQQQGAVPPPPEAPPSDWTAPGVNMEPQVRPEPEVGGKRRQEYMHQVPLQQVSPQMEAGAMAAAQQQAQQAQQMQMHQMQQAQSSPRVDFHVAQQQEVPARRDGEPAVCPLCERGCETHHRLGFFWRKFGYDGPPYCSRCSSVFRAHMVTRTVSNDKCSRAEPCNRCAKILSQFRTTKTEAFASMDSCVAKKPVVEKVEEDPTDTLACPHCVSTQGIPTMTCLPGMFLRDCLWL